MPTNSDSPDRTHCPLCGGDNQCAVAGDRGAADCWCFHTDIPREALDRLPPEAKGQRCICPHCARALKV